jgi:hypothetical protein
MVPGVGPSIAYGKSVWLTAFLHQNINGVYVLIDCPPKITKLAADFDEHLVEIPGVTQSALSFLKLSSAFRPEAVTPLPNGFIRDNNATFGQKIFYIPKAQTKAMIQPN